MTRNRLELGSVPTRDHQGRRTAVYFHTRRHSPVYNIVLTLFIMSAAVGFAREDLRRYPVAGIRVLDTEGEVGVEYHYFGEENSREGGTTAEFENNTFIEYLEYGNRGYIYHPLFLDYSAAIKLGMTQQRIRRSGTINDDEDLDSNTFVNGYDLYLKFFQEHPLSATLFANRDEYPVLGLFTDRYLIESETHGLTLNWRNDIAPMRATYSESKLEEFGVDSHTSTEYDTFEYTITNEINGWMKSRLRYRYQEFRQQFEAERPLQTFDRQTELDSHDVDFQNTIYLGQNKRSYLSSTGHYRTQEGTNDLTTYSWQERLRLQHTDDLSSYYLANFLRNELTNTTVDAYRAEAGLDHLLYQSLRSHLDLHWRQTQFEDLEDTRFGVTGRVDYRKDTGIGFLNAGYGVTVDQIQRDGRTGIAPVLDESITLSLGMIHFLDEPNVIEESIVVTDLAGLVIYAEGFDYEVVEAAGRTGIRLLPGGLIADGDTVLVDYQVELDNDLEYYQTDQNFYVRHDFEKYVDGLALYYRWHDVKPHGVELEENRLLELTDQVIGMSYTWRWLTWVEEYEMYDSNFGGYDEFRSRVSGSHRLNNRLRWNWNVGYDVTMYDEEIPTSGDDTAEFLFAGTSLNGRFMENNTGFWSVEARAMEEMGLVDRTIFGIAAKVGARWRKVRLESGVRFEQHEVFDSTRDRIHGYVQLAREF